MNDNQKAGDVLSEWVATAGQSITTKTVVSVVAQLRETYGDKFSIKEACDTLEELSRLCLRFKGSLEQKV